MQQVQWIKMKIILVCFLAVTLLCSGPVLAATADGGQENLAANTVQSTQGSQDENSKTKASLPADDSKAEFIKTFSINEINRYLSQMDADELAATLKLFRVMQLVKIKYVGDASTETMLAGAVKGAVGSLGDPYSMYLDPKAYKEMSIVTEGSFEGVGIVLGMKDNLLTVVAPIEGTPGFQAGILSGDRVIKIDGQDTKDMLLDEAVKRIRGSAGSTVTLTILRAGEEAKEYPLVRANIPLKSVSGKMLENNIGYIRITMFNKNTGEDFAKTMQELAGQGMTAVILDLRNNPGGLLEESVKVAGAFVAAGPVVSIVAKDGNPQTWYSQLAAPQYPLAVLVNGGSASASEIVAGAVQDTGAGTLIGTKTFGKGSVQNIMALGDNSAVKLTTAKYLTPKGRWINGTGIEPDIVLTMPDFKENGKDLQLEKAVEILQEKR